MRSRRFALAAALMLAAALCAAPALAGKTIEGSGTLETRTLDLAAFTKVDLGGAFDVQVGFGKTPKVEVTVDDNLWDNLEAEVADGRLSLDWDRHCKPSDGCTVRITMASLEEFALHGAGDVAISGVDGERLKIFLRGAGNVAMDGQVDDLRIVLSGAGNCEARGLKAKAVEVVLAGVGDCEVYASASIDAKVSGVGNVTYWGDPQEKSTKVTGLGNIVGR